MRAQLLRRRAYGLDQKGEVDDNRDMNIEDTWNASAPAC